MFKKLKDKIVEEAKNSPQRFQQITQSVSDKLQASTAEENFFSIDDDVDSRPSMPATPTPATEGGFTSVSLYSSTPTEARQRRTSNSSMASDVSFLPKYEPGNMYHLQSDIEASASEMEDNVSTSSTQMGHITKEQVYAELQRVRLRYHKYRGRYTDLANHYKDLERENGKMKSVLVETQDVSIRRIGELREQCQLEQKAKAHLENALRVEIDEKEYVIETLKTKIELLNTSNTSETVFEADNATGALTNGTTISPPSPELAQLSADLANAKTEILTLNEKLQELKASKIISQTKEANLLTRINELEAEMTKNTNNSSKLSKLAELEGKVAKMVEMEGKLAKLAELERKVAKMAELEGKVAKMAELEGQVAKMAELEDRASKMKDLEAQVVKMVDLEAKISELVKEKSKMEAERLKKQKTDEEYNLQMARDKMTLHTELQNKDLEISNLKSDLETVREDLESYEKESAPKNTKMDNLQSQNTKLIERVEVLSAKCNNMDAELLKMEQLRQKNKQLSEAAIKLKEVNKGFAEELGEFNRLKDCLGDTTEALDVSRNDIVLLSEEKTNLQQELESVVKSNGSLNEKFSNLTLEHNNLDSKYNNLLIDNTSLSDSLIAKNEELEKVRSDAKSSLLTLEGKITKKLQQKFDQKSEKLSKAFDEKVNKLTVNEDSVKDVQVKLLAREDSIKSLEDNLMKINEELAVSRKKYDELETNHLELIEENRENAADKVRALAEKNLGDKKLENDHLVIGQLKEQLEARFLEATSLKDRLEASKSNRMSLEERIRDLEQVLQDKDQQIAESASKLINDSNQYEATIQSLEDIIKLKNEAADKSRDELAKHINDSSSKKVSEELVKMLGDDLETAKLSNEALKSSLDASYNEISDLKSKLANGEVDAIKDLQLKLDGFARETEKLKLEKLDATAQVAKMVEEKLFGQKQLISIISEIKQEFINVQTENVTYQKQIEDLTSMKAHFEEVQLINQKLLEENQVKVDEITSEKLRLSEEASILKESLADASKMSGELSKLSGDKMDLVKEVSDLNKIVNSMTVEQRRFKQQIGELQVVNEEMGQAVEEKNKCLQEISTLKGNLQRLVSNTQHLEQQLLHHNDIQRQFSIVQSELTTSQEKNHHLTDELSLTTTRNRQLTEDRDRLVDENDKMISEVERLRLMAEQNDPSQQHAEIASLQSDIASAHVQIAFLTSELARSSSAMELETQPSSSDSDALHQKISELAAITRRFDIILEENRAVKEDLAEVGRLKELAEEERRRLELMVGDLDRSYSEMKHENQLLKDEIQELKISPMNLNTSSKPPNTTLSNGNNNNHTTSENPDLSKEIDILKEKVQQYKAIDVTNRSSIEFYELELDRSRARGDKLERKLDETLVTLRHCAELSGVDTQVEYLRHVLYNYMLGREGVVLARVIAAVCKFDSAQTDAVMKHEQQKQTLLGQLGIL